MMVRKIFFDMDGVLADFDRGIRELCGIPSLKQEAEDKAADERMWEGFATQTTFTIASS